MNLRLRTSRAFWTLSTETKHTKKITLCYRNSRAANGQLVKDIQFPKGQERCDVGLTLLTWNRLNSVPCMPSSPQYLKMALRAVQISTWWPYLRPAIPFLLECVMLSMASVCHSGQMAKALVCVPWAVGVPHPVQDSFGKVHLFCPPQGAQRACLHAGPTFVRQGPQNCISQQRKPHKGWVPDHVSLQAITLTSMDSLLSLKSNVLRLTFRPVIYKNWTLIVIYSWQALVISWKVKCLFGQLTLQNKSTLSYLYHLCVDIFF